MRIASTAGAQMTGERFGLDTNVLVYMVDTSDAGRRDRAISIVRAAAASGRCSLSLQNIGEFYVVVTRKGHMPPVRAAAQARDWTRLFRIVEPNAADIQLALGAASSGRLSYWDALLLATLSRSGCSTLLSEDMQDGSMLEGVTVRDPFKGDDLPGDIGSILS